MVKLAKRNEWTPLEMDGSVFNGGVEGLIGIEECSDYDLQEILSSKKSRKNKRKLEKDLIEAGIINIKPIQKKAKQEIETKIVNKKDKVKNKKKIKVVVPQISSSVHINTNNLTQIKGKAKVATNKVVKGKQNDFDVESDKSESDEDKSGSDDEIDSNSEEINTAESEIEPNMHAWSIVPLPQEIIDALAFQKFENPTEIQGLTLPAAILGRRDILGAAETGSGKTLAFGLPIVAGIMKLKEQAALENAEIENDESDDLNTNAIYENSDAESENSDQENASLDEEIDSDMENDDSDVDNDDSDINNDDSDVENDDSEADNIGTNQENDDSKDDQESEESDFDEVDEKVPELDEHGIGCVRSINNIQIGDPKNPRKPLYALILTPTRELAVQIKNHLIAATKFTDIRVAVLVGGMAAVKQERVLSKGPEIVVATPGRLWELILQGNPHLSQVDDIRYFAIDETDRMVEKGHFQELHHLLERINMNEAKKKLRQNFVFSATLTLVHELPRHLLQKKKIRIKNRVADMTPAQKLQKLIEMLGITNPKIVDITQTKATPGTLTECRITCPIDEKDFYVYYFLQRHPGRTLIFCNSIGCVKRLTTLLSLLNCSPLPLHASMQQRQRLRNLDRFRDRADSILVATDVAARGLDIPEVEHVLHYQTPRTSESYVHRSGRTARASREGITVLLVEPAELTNYLRLCRTLGKTEDMPSFPVQANYLNAVKQRVNLAVQLDKLELQVKKANSEVGWFQKAADDMDMIVDDVSLKYDMKEARGYKKSAEFKRKQLTALLAKPVFPKGFSGSYPLSGNAIDLAIAQGSTTSSESAIEVMKSALNDTKAKKSVRKNPKNMFKQRIKRTDEKINAKELMKPKQKGKGNKKGSPGKRVFRKNNKK